jgi:translation initiation factor IF-2
VPNPDKAPGRRFANKADRPDYDKRKPTRRTFDAPQRRSGNNRPVQFRGARGSLKRKRNRDDREAKQKEAVKPVIVPDEPISVGALAELLEKSGAEVVKHLMLKMGVLAAVTQNVDGATARLVVEGFGREWAASADEVDDEDDDDDQEDSGPALALSSGIAIDEDDPDSLQPRSPVVTIMGHVDHGKTSLLDALREADVVSGEAGGITQGIGAYVVPVKDRAVTFIDTPGHAAFTEMRERGANVTDIVVLVVAADDGCKEQTVDSLACAKLAGAPVVVAVNKMDVEGADAQRVEGELMSYDLVPESAGGDTLVARVSAKEKTGLDELLEKVLLQADLLDLKANPDRPATGTVIEAGVEKGLGVCATTLVERGTLRVGDVFTAGAAWGKCRALQDEFGNSLEEAGPSTPVRLVGWTTGADRAPRAGDALSVVPDEPTARKLADARNELANQARDAKLRAASSSGFDKFMANLGGEGIKEERTFPIVLKADTAGSVEAITSSLEGLDVQDDVSRVKAKVIYSGVGDLTKSDVAVASVQGAFVVAFNVGSNAAAMDEERRLSGAVRTNYYSVVYDVLEEIEGKLQKVLSPTPDGELVGTAVVKQCFDIGKLGKVAGCGVETGWIRKSANIRVMRGDAIMYQGRLRTLRSVKVDVERIDAGSDCGLSFRDWEEVEVGDVVEAYEE